MFKGVSVCLLCESSQVYIEDSHPLSSKGQLLVTESMTTLTFPSPSLHNAFLAISAQLGVLSTSFGVPIFSFSLTWYLCRIQQVKG